MRILLVTPLFFPSLSGAAVYFETLSQALDRREPARITILTRALAGAPRRERRGRVQVLRLLPAASSGSGLPERAAAVGTAAMVLLVSLAARSQVVHYHTLVSYRAIHRLAPLFRAPLVGDMRDLAARDEGASLAPYRHCSRLICASENIQAFLATAGIPPDRLAHIPIPLDPPPPAPPSVVAGVRARYGVPDEPFLLFAGAISPAKGIGELLDAMDRVWRTLPGLHLVLAGPLPAAGDALVPGGFRARVAADARLHYLGPVPHAELLALLRGAAMLVLPSRSEGLPRSCLEAIALGRKVVVPPGIPEFLRACPEAVLEDVTPKAIAARIERTWHAAGPPTYPLAAHDPDRVAALTLAVYRQVAG